MEGAVVMTASNVILAEGGDSIPFYYDKVQEQRHVLEKDPLFCILWNISV